MMERRRKCLREKCWNQGLYSWQTGSEPDEMSWTHGQNEDERLSKRGDTENKEVAANEKDHGRWGD